MPYTIREVTKTPQPAERENNRATNALKRSYNWNTNLSQALAWTRVDDIPSYPPAGGGHALATLEGEAAGTANADAGTSPGPPGGTRPSPVPPGPALPPSPVAPSATIG